MAVIDRTANQGSQPLNNVPPAAFIYEKVIDFSKAENNMALADTMDLFDLPAGVLVCGAKVEVLTAEGTAVTGDLGVTGGDVDRYIDGADLNAAGVTMSGDATTAEPASMETSGLYLSAAETVSLSLATAGLSAALVRFQIFGFALDARLNDQDGFNVT
jgi:hypothetical protein